MRAVIQRVTQAAVSVDSEVVSSIGKGLCVLIGITHDDSDEDVEYIAKKLVNMRLFEDQEGRMWRCSAKDLSLDILCVSQFTLYAKTAKGSKPDFHLAMKADASRDFYARFLERVRAEYGSHPEKVHDGRFGAMMHVALTNDGPVTIELDSNARTPVGKQDK